MSEFRLSPEAEAELDEIWLHIARSSDNIEIATRVVDGIVDRFWLLARHSWVARVTTCGSACAASQRTTMPSSIVSESMTWC